MEVLRRFQFSGNNMMTMFNHINDNDNNSEIDLFRHHNKKNTNTKVISKQMLNK